MVNNQPVGIFDSGIGGLSVANAIYRLLPHESLVYYADTGHVPYGPRTTAEIRDFSFDITEQLLGRGCKMIVLACNTATAAALEALREHWPDVPFVGMEPAVKPAAAATQTGKVGVLATLSTIRSERYTQLMERYANHIEVMENPCIGLVDLIEAGQLDSPQTRALLSDIVQPMLAADVDTLVLGCTHYPVLLPLLHQITGENIHLIDPAPAVARQVARRLATLHLAASDSHQPVYQFMASGTFTNLSFLTEIPFEVV
ncbi:MAG: glutamate racemase [Saprospiraceae bacterium]